MLTTTLTKDYTDRKHEHVPCPLCDAKSDSLLATRGYPGIPVRNVICRACGLIRIDPRMTQEEYERFYREDFFEYLNPYSRPEYVKTFEHTKDTTGITVAERTILPYILPYVKGGGRILDIGSGFGQVPYLLQKKNHVSYVAIEPDPSSRQVAKEKIGIELEGITIEEFLSQDRGLFDFIYMDQVFEHLLSPLEILKKLAQILTPEGVIYIGVPNSFNPGVSVDRYFELAHTYGYTPATLARFAELSGLKVISLRDPFAPALEVLLMHQNTEHKEEDSRRLQYGNNWRSLKLRLKKKIFIGRVRSAAKVIITTLFGNRIKELLRQVIDRR